MRNRKPTTTSRKVTLSALLVACALILSWLELFIPMPIPGMKIGLANLAVVLTLYLIGPGYASLVDIIRVFLAGFLFGSMGSILYSLSGALLSLVIMILFYRLHFGELIVSVFGGMSHNVGQLLCASAIMRSPALIPSWGPFLLFAGLCTGLIVGIVARILIGRLRNII